MASAKLVVALGTAGLLSGALWMFQPPSPDPHERSRQQQQQQVNDLSDADQQQRDRYRDAGNDHVNAENARRVTPGEYRPPEPHVRLRLP